MRELAVILENGAPVYWHEPANATAGSIPDSRDFFNELWSRRDRDIAVAHLHPWEGYAIPSSVDLETFEAIDLAFGRHIGQMVVTFTHIWGSGPLSHEDLKGASWIEEMRRKGGKT